MLQRNILTKSDQCLFRNVRRSRNGRAIYTRKSTEHNLDLEFNSLDAQREAREAYTKSQAHEGWRAIPDHYDDGGLSGASLDRPALQTLLGDIRARKIDIVVVYKVDRLTRALGDFAKLVDVFDEHSVSFVSVTQSLNTTSSMGLNMLLSFAQFEREVIGERVRDKIAASKKKGIWVGGSVPLGYPSVDKKVVICAGGCREGADHLPPLSRSRLDTGSSPVSATTTDPHPAPDPLKRKNSGGHPIRSRSAPSTAAEPVSHRRRGLSWGGLSRRT